MAEVIDLANDNISSSYIKQKKRKDNRQKTFRKIFQFKEDF